MFKLLPLLLVSIICESCMARGGRSVYVSSSLGTDVNTGMNESSPVKTIKKAIILGDTILLKTGDVFNERIELNGKTIKSYGNGRKPIVCGYKRIKNPKWEYVTDSIWKSCLAANNYQGYKTEGATFYNNIGCIHEYDKDLVHGRRVRHLYELVEEWDFWQSEHYKKNETRENDFDSIYLRIGTDPNSLKIEYSIGGIAISCRNSMIEDLRIEGFGFGISASTEVIIKNCEIDAIGGMLVVNDTEFVSYGNGIEFYVSQDIENCIVENCIISRCYDCGITIQGSDKKKATPRNIIIRNNLIERSCQGWEDFLRNDSNVVYNNCIFENNLVLNSGNTSGFGYPDSRFKYCHVLGNNFKGDKGMIIRNNTFVGGNYYCSGAYNGKYKSNKWQGNTCVIKRGDFLLGNYTGTKDVIRIPVEKGEFPTLKDATENAILRYRDLTGDMTTKFIIKDEKTINKQIIKLKRKFLKK